MAAYGEDLAYIHHEGFGAFAGSGRAAQHTTRTFTVGEDWAALVKRKEEGRHLTRRITSFVKRGRAWRRSDEEHLLTLCSPQQMLALLRKAGLTAQLRAAHAPGHYAVLAR